ncbi:MAG: hypothetical protein GVY28_07295 [Alphaproteobacteria bacterium]|jgi:hypothetical protein|nr:hypothetical protein [Alphaproteobacteria bacterium]
MAISKIEYNLIANIHELGLIQGGERVLEIGQSNWYGDVPIRRLWSDIDRLVKDETAKAGITSKLQALAGERPEGQRRSRSFELARLFFDVFVSPSRYEAIDFHGTELAHKFDLNQPIPLEGEFDIVLNIGTAEHVFNVFQVFKTIHEKTAAGGLIIIAAPFQGWVDHGFYNFQPTFFFDLAAANQYRLLLMVYSEIKPPKMIQIRNRRQFVEMASAGTIGPNPMIHTVFRMPADKSPFAVPMQGYYAGTVPDELRQAWKTLR